MYIYVYMYICTYYICVYEHIYIYITYIYTYILILYLYFLLDHCNNFLPVLPAHLQTLLHVATTANLLKCQVKGQSPYSRLEGPV